LKNNDKLFTNHKNKSPSVFDRESPTDNQIFAQKFINDDTSGLLSNKDIFEKIDRSMLNDESRKEEAKSNYSNGDGKRKPFKAFVFEK
jgi:hypothetical protein